MRRSAAQESNSTSESLTTVGEKTPTLRRLMVDKNDGSVGLYARRQFHFSLRFFSCLSKGASPDAPISTSTSGGALAPDLCPCYSSRLKPLLPPSVATKVAPTTLRFSSSLTLSLSAARESSPPKPIIQHSMCLCMLSLQ